MPPLWGWVGMSEPEPLETWTQEQIDDLMYFAATAMTAAVNREVHTLAQTFAAVAGKYGSSGIYSLCLCFAETICGYTGARPEPGTAVAAVLLVGDINADDPPDEARAPLWAARFTAAYANGDDAMTRALFLAPLEAGEEDHARTNVAALVGMAGDIIRTRGTGAAR